MEETNHRDIRMIQHVIAEFDLEISKHHERLYVRPRQGQMNDTLRAFIKKNKPGFMHLAVERVPYQPMIAPPPPVIREN